MRKANTMVRPRRKKDDVIVVKKYANRRLYDTGRSSYVTLDDLCEMIKEGQEFVVTDAKTGEDLTQSVLTQIIVEQEAKGQSMLPPAFLRTIIKFYGDSMQGLVPNYLEQAMQSFVHNQEQLRDNMSKSFTSMMPGGTPFDEMNRKNMEMFNQTMQMFSPFRVFTPGQNGQPQQPGQQRTSPQGARPPSRDERIRNIKQTISSLQEELRGLI